MAKRIKPQQPEQAPEEEKDNVVHLTPGDLELPSTTSDHDAASVELDPETLRLDQNFVDVGGSKKLIDIIEIRKPPKQEFVRAHPDPAYSWVLGILELEGEKEYRVVTPAVARTLGNEIYIAQLTLAITRHEVLFGWLAKLPIADSNSVATRWNNSMLAAKEHARKQWVRVMSNMRAGYYETRAAEIQPPDPVWPDLTPKQVLNIIVRGKLIDSLSDPVLKSLRGA